MKFKPPKTSVYRPPPGTGIGDAYANVEHDLFEEATEAELDWLEDHPLMWLRALSMYERMLQTRTGMDKLKVSRMAPDLGKAASQEYLDALKELKRKTQYRLHLLELIQVRREEAKSLIDDDSLTTMMTVGDLTEIMLQILDHAKRDEYEHIESSCQGILARIKRKVEERDGRELQ